MGGKGSDDQEKCLSVDLDPCLVNSATNITSAKTKGSNSRV